VLREMENPILIGPRLTLRALDDLHTIAQAAGQVAATLHALERRASRIETQLDSAIAVARSIDAQGRAAMGTVTAVDERLLEALGATEVISERALQIATQATELASALPLLQRAIEMAEPLAGAVERLGRVVDRLPGAAPRPRTRARGGST
jgi:hypothetical protein